MILVLVVKVYFMKKAAVEIEEAFTERLESENNTQIGISSRDKEMRKLAKVINDQLRKLRKERQRFQLGDQEVKNAITNISHDIRTPLTSIWGYLELLEEEDIPETAARYVKIIEDRTEMLRNMAEELFDYSVDMSTSLELKPEPVDVNRVLLESIVAFYTEFSDHGIVPNIKIPEVRIIRRADLAALARVFSNLLGNAVKYSDGDLTVMLSEHGEITFSNNAKELNSFEVGKLFDRFYTVKSTRQSRGLGLSIAKILVEGMDGKITAEYKDNRLNIRVWLPDIK